MIFVTVGSQKFQFNRLIKMVDKFIEDGKISDNEVIGQIGSCSYEPKNFKTKKFYEKIFINELYDKADIIITHGGTGSIISALERNKKVIVIPRESKYGEHVDDHQFQITKLFVELNYCFEATDEESFSRCLARISEHKFSKFKSNNDFFFSNLLNLINSESV
ncbi:hypothetical protein UAW_00189 [Enterococcus haemoperoxidus ATCC BAA-382]|uniref:Glycosyl transferase family 28 C-terminal domain-containing protein n=1 Tax=Enterococcus haemoperoxidus ATCC BAA-382 TaxID=1158608 RepID=R2QUH0_9ENTE|nr:PssE/Cps14G family polysaccharide biosynthesis glycosyltransferase [Enterococcus haemoperoxidus]EOI00175.1 hypothetical protein UAW_00189 [Enterococcus haemoperoxidus ATCC BAA-382]EOT59587.1 hypothetical protein I583_02222 [Enterococcus haemoperoxidus ATCC BAA-382]OJG52424.1 hypothetical protein RV06_GL000995 [Enterococcus haemoperoxidus]